MEYKYKKQSYTVRCQTVESPERQLLNIGYIKMEMVVPPCEETSLSMHYRDEARGSRCHTPRCGVLHDNTSLQVPNICRDGTVRFTAVA